MRIILLVLGVTITTLSTKAQGTIEVMVEEVESGDGSVVVCIYNSEDGFPNEWDKAYLKKSREAKKGNMQFSFENVPFGTYAIAVSQDENDNGEIETNFIGFPKEPVGVSNLRKFGKPSFSKSKVELSSAQPEMAISINFIN